MVSSTVKSPEPRYFTGNIEHNGSKQAVTVQDAKLKRMAWEDAPPPSCDPQNPSPEMLIWAYGHGVFPMANPEGRHRGRLDWFSPDPRAVFPLHPPDAFHVPKNLAREVRRQRFKIQSDSAFEQVMQACSEPRDPEDLSWIDARLIKCYTALFERGFAHSVEAWRDGQLVGGLYGVHIGGAFFGESMFSRPELGGSNSSKICLVHLVDRLRLRGFALLDTQFTNPNLEQFGVVEISADEYLAQLSQAVRLDVAW
jgi:leucyl/phenylalanyl-tRNA--protein transferase